MSYQAKSSLGIAALLAASAVIVTAANAVSASYEGRAAKADKPVVAVEQQAVDPCTQQTWPHIAANCLDRTAVAEPRKLRYITVDRIVAPNTTALMRIPAQSASLEQPVQ
ncbi:MAG: hypothetical protein KDJ16_12340 [Hyphomicrobiales bacterium]|nr:hypothetical protein [Hyphomicrobiales bacterium]